MVVGRPSFVEVWSRPKRGELSRDREAHPDSVRPPEMRDEAGETARRSVLLNVISIRRQCLSQRRSRPSLETRGSAHSNGASVTCVSAHVAVTVASSDA